MPCSCFGGHFTPLKHSKWQFVIGKYFYLFGPTYEHSVLTQIAHKSLGILATHATHGRAIPGAKKQHSYHGPPPQLRPAPPRACTSPTRFSTRCRPRHMALKLVSPGATKKKTRQQPNANRKLPSPSGCGSGRPYRGSGGSQRARVPRNRLRLPRVGTRLTWASARSQHRPGF